MALPAGKLEVQFDVGGQWVDITKDLERPDVTITRGRASVDSDAQVGVGSVQLRNAAGKYDPLNATGPYAGKLKPLRRVRYSTVLPDGTPSRRFTGRVRGWPQSWLKGGRYGLINMPLLDGLRDLAAYRFTRSYAGQVEDDKPTFWWRLSEAEPPLMAAATAPSGDSPPFDVALLVAGGVGQTSRVTSLVPGDGLGARRITGTAPQIQGSIFAPADFTVEVLWKQETLGANGTTAYAYRSTGSTYVRAAYTGGAATAFYEASVDNPGVGTASIPLSTAVRPVAGRTDHVVLRRTGTTVAVFVNGVQLGSVNINSGSIGLGSGGGGAARFGDRDTAGQPLVIDEPAIYFAALPDARIAAHYATIATAAQFAQQTVAQRVNGLLDLVGWTDGRSIADSGRQCAPTGDLGGRTALDVLQETVKVDIGLAFCGKDGALVTLDRPSAGGQPTWILGDGFGEVAYLGDLVIEYDEQRVFNDWTVTAPATETTPMLQARAVDAASVTEFGPAPRTNTHSAPYANQADVDAAAAYLLARYKQPSARIDRVTVDVAADPDRLPFYAGVAIGQKVRVIRRPPGAPAIVVDCLVEQTSDQGGLNKLQTQLVLSPAP